MIFESVDEGFKKVAEDAVIEAAYIYEIDIEEQDISGGNETSSSWKTENQKRYAYGGVRSCKETQEFSTRRNKSEWKIIYNSCENPRLL